MSDKQKKNALPSTRIPGSEQVLLRLAREDQERFADALLYPPPVSDALKRSNEARQNLIQRK